MTYQRKSEFIDGLKEALSRCGIAEQREILLDFEQHFSDGAAAGETEAQTCEKLGDPEEIAKQYIPDTELSLGEPPKKPAPSDPSEQPYASENPPIAEKEAPLASGFGAEAAEEAAEPENWEAVDRVFNAGETWEAEFSPAGLRRVEVKIASAVARIAAGDTDTVRISYRAERSGIRFAARMENGTLFVKESADFSVLSPGRAAELEITLPRREYEEFALSLASGKVFTEALTGGRFTAEIMSGSAVLGAFAEEISVTVRSGSMELNNCGVNGMNRTARLLKLSGFSGKSVVRGFFTERFELEQKSGAFTVEGITGKGEVHVKSGFVSVGYAEWDGDLSADVTSGNLKVALPHGSGAYLNTNVTSGSVSVALDGETAKFGRGNSGVRIGGANLHRISAGVTSGSVKIENSGAFAANTASPFVQGAPLPPPAQNKNNAPDPGKIVGVLCVDLFVFSWAIPSLASLVTALFACAFSLGVTGITTFVGGMMMGVTDVSAWFTSGFSPVSTVLLGALMISGCVLLALASIRAATGFVNVILRIVNWHSRAFVGRNVCTLMGKKYRQGGNTV